MAEPAAAQETWLSAEEAGFLTDGPGRAAETVLARLIDTGLVRVSRGGLVSAVRKNGHGATTAIEARMLGQARTAVRFGAIILSATDSTEMDGLHRHLLDRGLVQVPRRRNEGWWFSLAVAGLLTLAGFLSPAFFIGVPIALGFFVWQYGRSPLTKAGKDALRHVTAHDRVHAVALYGFTGKVGGQDVGELFDLPQNIAGMIPPKPREGSSRSSSDLRGRRSSPSRRSGSSGTAGGCGSGSDSSCGSGSSCGGGGGGD